MSKQASYFIVVPSPVRLCRATPEGAKLLYGDIAGLADKHGFCFASDEYLADIAGKTTRQVNTYLKRLESNGHIRVEGRFPDRKIYVGEMKVSSELLKETAEPNEENFNDTIYTNTVTNTVTKEAVQKYFFEEKHLPLSVSANQAEAFLEYHNEQGNLTDGKYRARAHQWFKRGIEYGKIVDPGKGRTANEIANPDTGLIDTTRWERRGNLYYRV